jgi:potassium/hydrogen antiporter
MITTSIETILIVFSVLLIVSIVGSKASSRFGIPSLLFFLFIGMLAGSEGIGRLSFDDPKLAQYVGVVALVFILFSGGLETEWKTARHLTKEGLVLSTFGVLLTALILGLFVTYFTKFSLIEGLLLGAIVSSTDAAAVFSMLRSKKVSLQGELRPLLEFESGSNDPMAVFLTISFIELLTSPQRSFLQMFPMFVLQMGVGAVFGYLSGKGLVFLVNKIKLEYDGLYPVLTMATILLAYSLTSKLMGNGFLAVYIAGIMVGNSNIIQKRYLIHFHGGLAWLMQIAMFLTMGLLVFPSHLIPVAPVGILIALFLMFVARPASVFLSLAPTHFNLREKVFISWVGLRGSVPIILATFPLLAGIDKSGTIFNIVFFIVLASALLQGTSIPLLAKWLGVDSPLLEKKKYPIEFEQTDALNTRMIDFTIPYNSWMIGRPVSEIGLPQDSLITLVARNEDFIVPSGRTVIEAGDVLLTLVNNNNLQEVLDLFSKIAPNP